MFLTYINPVQNAAFICLLLSVCNPGLNSVCDVLLYEDHSRVHDFKHLLGEILSAEIQSLMHYDLATISAPGIRTFSH